MARDRLVIALDGVDRVGKTILTNALSKKMNIPVISNDLLKAIATVPIEVRIWADIPILSILNVCNNSAILDRSIISVLAYNYGTSVNEKIKGFLEWYKANIDLFVFMTYVTFDTLFGREKKLLEEKTAFEDDMFRRVYDEFGIDKLELNAEDSLEYNLNCILGDENVSAYRC